MTQRSAGNNIRLGLFVLVGMACLMAMMFLLGRKQNLFSSSLQVKADFRNVSGLLKGNNVRLAGIPVGTVRDIRILNDSTVRVVMNLNRDVQPFVKKNAIASIGTDGLVGNTIVNLTAAATPAPSVEPGDVLPTKVPVSLEGMLGTLNVSSKNLIGITQDLRQITQKLNGSEALWALLDDKDMAGNLRQTMGHAARATAELEQSSRELHQLTRGIGQGRGPAGYLLTDTAFAGQLGHATRQLAGTSDTLARTVAHLKRQVSTGAGPLNTLLTDTTFSRQMRQSMRHVEEGTAGFNQTMTALQHNFLVRGYLKRQQKRQARAAHDTAVAR